MSGSLSARDIEEAVKNLRKFEVELPPDEASPAIVSVGDPIPDLDLLYSLLEQNTPLQHLDTPQVDPGQKPNRYPDLVLINFERLTFDAQQKVRNAKSKHHAPVVCLISPEDMERVALIDSLGADEVLFKPVDPKEFSCRIGILLRRHRKRQGAPSIDRRAQFRRKADVQRLQKAKNSSRSKVQIDDERKLVRLGDRSIVLTPKEYRLFCLLASEAGRVFSANEIIAHLWKNRQRVSTGDVQQYVYLLRKKVESNIHQPQWIETVKGFGYRLNLAGT